MNYSYMVRSDFPLSNDTTTTSGRRGHTSRAIEVEGRCAGEVGAIAKPSSSGLHLRERVSIVEKPAISRAREHSYLDTNMIPKGKDVASSQRLFRSRQGSVFDIGTTLLNATVINVSGASGPRAVMLRTNENVEVNNNTARSTVVGISAIACPTVV